MTYVIRNFKSAEIVETLKKMQKRNQTDLMVGKVIKKKSNKRYAKWNDYDHSFNSRND